MTQTTEILIIEDDKDIQELVQYNFERQGFRVRTADDGEAGLQQALQIPPAVILLDLMLPGIDGLKVCKKLRESNKTRNTPLIMLTAKGEESDVVVGLEMGADDYVTKPFSPKELIARVRAVLRRGPAEEIADPEAEEQVAVGPLSVNVTKHEVYLNSEPLQLTLAEFKLIYTLMSRPGRVFTRNQLLEVISGGDTYLIDRNVDVHIRSLRKKLGDDSDFIGTIRGVGYKCKE